MKTAKGIKNEMLVAAILVSATLAFSFVCYFLPMLAPSGEAHEVWFQRSGSLVVASAIWAEFTLVRLDGYVDPNNEKYSVITDMPQSISKAHLLFSRFALVCVIIGTVIWGYGDRFVKTHNQLQHNAATPLGQPTCCFGCPRARRYVYEEFREIRWKHQVRKN